MSFWDEHPDTGGGAVFLTPDEKEELVNTQQPFDITGVSYQAENKFGPRYLVDLLLTNPATGDPENRKVGFPAESGVESRNNLLQAMIDDHFGAGVKTPISAILAMGGQAYLLKPAPEVKPKGRSRAKAGASK